MANTTEYAAGLLGASKQEMRSALSKQKLLEATVKIIRTHGISKLSVRAICAEAGLSTGAFYHLFNSKEDVINYYLTYTFERYKAEAMASNEGLSAVEKVCNIYRYMVRCYEEAGYEFMTAFYTPENSLLNYRERSEEEGVVLEEAMHFIEEGQANGEIRQDIDLEETKLMVAALATGVLFYWCVFKGDLDAGDILDRNLRQYLSSIEVS